MDMAVARRHRVPEDPPIEEAPKRTRPRRVRDADPPAEGRNPVAEHLILLEDAFSKDPAGQLPRYPGKVRLAILIGAPVAMWALIAGAAIGLKALF
jgi:hypothetical protein